MMKTCSLIPVEKVGLIIGEHQFEIWSYLCVIKKQDNHNDQFIRCKIRGSPEAIENAKALITEKLQKMSIKEPGLNCTNIFSSFLLNFLCQTYKRKL